MTTEPCRSGAGTPIRPRCLFVLDVYPQFLEFPADERFGVTAHPRKSVAPVASNITEGCGSDPPAWVLPMKGKHLTALALLAIPLFASQFWRSERSLQSERTAADRWASAPAGGGVNDEDALLGAGKDLPDALRAVDAAQLKATIRRMAGQGALVNVWATWCGPCQRELPMLIGLRERLEAVGIHLVFVSVDEPDDAEAVVDFLRQHAAPRPGYLVRGSLERFKHQINPRWPGMLPASFLFDSSGKLRHFFGGEVFAEELWPIIEGFVAGKNIDGESHFGLAPGRVDGPGEPTTR